MNLKQTRYLLYLSICALWILRRIDNCLFFNINSFWISLLVFLLYFVVAILLALRYKKSNKTRGFLHKSDENFLFFIFPSILILLSGVFIIYGHLTDKTELFELALKREVINIISMFLLMIVGVVVKIFKKIKSKKY